MISKGSRLMLAPAPCGLMLRSWELYQPLAHASLFSLMRKFDDISLSAAEAEAN